MDSSVFKLDQSIGFLIYRAALRGRAEVQRALDRAHIKLTADQAVVLNVLGEKEGVSQSELAERAFKDKPNMTRLIDRLEQLSLVERREDETDRRSFRLYLTPKGNELRDEVLRLIMALMPGTYQGFSEEDKKRVLFLINKLYSNLCSLHSDD